MLVKAPFLLVLFIGFAAFAVDMGFYHLKKAQVQTAAEACAFAAGYRQASDTGGLTNEAVMNATMDLARLNAPGCLVEYDVNGKLIKPSYEWGTWTQSAGFVLQTSANFASALRVTVTMNHPRFFGTFFDPAARTVKGRSTVIWTPYGDVWPMALASKTDVSGGRSFTLGVDSSNNVPGNKGWLSFNNTTNVPDLNLYLNGGPYDASRPSPWQGNQALNQMSSGSFVLGNGANGASVTMPGAPGLKNSTKSTIEAQINAGMIVLIPIFDSAAGNGANATYKIVGLVPVQLVPPYAGIDAIKVKILPEGAHWFPPNTNPAQTMANLLNPHEFLTMVE